MSDMTHSHGGKGVWVPVVAAAPVAVCRHAGSWVVAVWSRSLRWLRAGPECVSMPPPGVQLTGLAGAAAAAVQRLLRLAQVQPDGDSLCLGCEAVLRPAE